MPEFADRTSKRVPPRALALSVASLVVPVVGALAFPEALGNYGALLWLTALIPGFLLAYYRGWRGVATALALGMATLSFTQVVASWMALEVPDLLMAIVVAYLGVSLGTGWLAELLHRDLDAVEGLAFTDILTRLPNRRHARMFLENEFAAAERGLLLSVVLFDLDHFKQYNDEYGHAAGDDALKVFSEILDENTRRMNLSARYGGEEFLTVLAGSDSEGALVFADRVRTTLQGRGLGSGPLTVSAGASMYHAGMGSPDELLAAADRALYQAKRDGRNCARLFGRPLLDTDSSPPEGNALQDSDARQRRALEEVLQGVRHLVAAVEMRDPHSKGHAARVARYAGVLARALREGGYEIDLGALAVACEVHDVGKIRIPAEILTEPGPLSEEALRKVRAHPQAGRRILKPILDDETVLRVVRWHHERWDGEGYPDGLSGASIPLEARVVAVADALDAMTSERAFREALPWEEALDRIRADSGTQFDPDLIPVVERCAHDLLQIHSEARQTRAP